jgi:prepilin-type N-terminal cleavage/methylation domain-containing protein
MAAMVRRMPTLRACFFNVFFRSNVCPRHRSGFSLIELMVVVAIVSILASLLLPGLTRAKEYAYFTVCKNNLKQIGYGLTIYASDNDGNLPEGYNRCTGNIHTWGMRRIGRTERYSDGSSGGANITGVQRHLVGQIYEHEYPGENWEGKTQALPNGPFCMGRPRQAGKYLPIEILWCPIAALRNWSYSGTERERDEATRGWAFFGYSLFLRSVGCDGNRVAHTVETKWGDGGAGLTSDAAEQPFRRMTRFGQPHTSKPSSVWLATDYPPYKNSRVRQRPGHFGATTPWPGFRFNVVHMDGHVHDDIGREQSCTGKYTWCLGKNDYWVPYGWRWQGSGANREIVTNMRGAFDMNKNQR